MGWGYQFSRIFSSVGKRRYVFRIGDKGHQERGVRNVKGVGVRKDHSRQEHPRRLSRAGGTEGRH